MEKSERKLHIAIIILAMACLAAMAVFVFSSGPDIITKEVKGLTLSQNRGELTVKWDEMDCDGYDLEFICEGKHTRVPQITENSYIITNISMGKTYKVKVSARLKSGKNSRKATAEITTKKLKQKLKVDINEFSGFEGDRFTITAKGKGTITFSSGRAQVVSVKDNGTVKLKEPGQAIITVSASGDGMHESASENIPVKVYPEEFDKVKDVKVENVSGSRAAIKWTPDKLAASYVIMKKNAATGKYEQICETGQGETSVELTRNNGQYAVAAKAVVQERTINGKISDPVKIRGTADGAKTYSSGHNIKALNSSNLKLIREIHGDGSTNIPQSLSLTKDCYVVSYVNRGGTEGKFISYKKNGELSSICPAGSMGHANGSTYNPNTNKFYVVKTHQSIRTASCSTYDGTTKNSAGIFNLPRVTSGIAYDESNNKYYLSKGNEIYVCDSNFKVEKFIHKFVRYNHAQDIGAYNGVVFVCTWVSGSTSYIDMYRASDGAYLGSYDVSMGEIESCVIDDGYLVILMNTVGSSNDRLYITKERIAF